MVGEFNASGKAQGTVAIPLQEKGVVAVQGERDSLPVIAAKEKVFFFNLRRIGGLKTRFRRRCPRHGKAVNEIQLEDLHQSVPEAGGTFAHRFDAFSGTINDV